MCLLLGKNISVIIPQYLVRVDQAAKCVTLAVVSDILYCKSTKHLNVKRHTSYWIGVGLTFYYQSHKILPS